MSKPVLSGLRLLGYALSNTFSFDH